MEERKSGKIACQCQELRAFFFFLTKVIQQQLLLQGWLQSLPGALLCLCSRDCVFSGSASSAEGGAVYCVSVPVLPAQGKGGCQLFSTLINF